MIGGGEVIQFNYRISDSRKQSDQPSEEMGGSDPAGTRVASALFGDGVVGGHISTRLCPPTKPRESDGLDLGES
jgi:hypothetical protein